MNFGLCFTDHTDSRYDSLDGGSARRKAATYTGQHKHRINANIHVSSGIRTHNSGVWASEDSSSLRPRGHRDRHYRPIVYSKFTGFEPNCRHYERIWQYYDNHLKRKHRDISRNVAYIILWRVDQLLRGYSVNNDRFWNLLSKHVPASTSRHATTELLLETGCFYMVRAELL
jgi:hypothetical protein